MKKIFLFSIIIGLSFSCAKKVTQENTVKKQQDVNPGIIVGGDHDAHGCKPSAGYTWSALKKECVQLFIVGTKLNPTEEQQAYSTGAYVVFDGDKAELFLGAKKETIILERKSEGDSWIKDDWQLIPWKGYVLKKEGKIILTGM